MRIVLKGNADTNGVLKILQDEANKHLKLRLPKDGVGKVTGEVADDGSIMAKVPVDTRYKQDPQNIMAMYQGFSKKVNSRYGVNEGYLIPVVPM